MLRDFRLVHYGRYTDADELRPEICSIRQLKLEDNAKFLVILAQHEKEYKEQRARMRIERQRMVDAKAGKQSSAVADATTDDSLSLLGDLLVEAMAAIK